MAANPVPAVSAKTALLAGASPEPARGAPTLDAIFAHLLSQGAHEADGASIAGPSDSSPAAAQPKAADRKNVPATAALMALIQAGQPQPAAVPAPVDATASAYPPTDPAAPAGAADAAPAVRTATPPQISGETNEPKGGKTGQVADTETAAANNLGRPDMLASLKTAMTAAQSRTAATVSIAASPATPQAAAADGAQISQDAAQGQSQHLPELQALVAAHKNRKAPDEQSTQAKALPIRFDAPAARADAKQDAQADSATGQPKNERMADAQPDTRATAALPQPRGDADTQAAHNTPAPQAQTSASQQTANNTGDAGANAASSSSTSSAMGSVAASSAAQPQTAQASTPVLQVVPQQTPAAGLVPPDPAALAISIAAKSKDGEKHFDIRLDPPELGRVDVRLSVDSSGKAQAHLTADNQQTLNLLQRDRQDLARSLKDAGLNLSNNGLNFSLKGQDRQDNSAPAPKGGSALGLKAVANGEAPIPATKIHGLTASRSRLDIRV